MTQNLSLAAAAHLPKWLNEKIEAMKASPVQQERLQVEQWLYKGKKVYLIPNIDETDVMDGFTSHLYTEKGKLICAPTGGFAGTGDGKCGDFLKVARNKKTIWVDDRIVSK